MARTLPSLNRAWRAAIIEGYDQPKGLGWRLVDKVALDLADRMTLHNGPIPRFY